jgi:hypothetical protein
LSEQQAHPNTPRVEPTTDEPRRHRGAALRPVARFGWTQQHLSGVASSSRSPNGSACRQPGSTSGRGATRVDGQARGQAYDRMAGGLPALRLRSSRRLPAYRSGDLPHDYDPQTEAAPPRRVEVSGSRRPISSPVCSLESWSGEASLPRTARPLVMQSIARPTDWPANYQLVIERMSTASPR